MFSEEIAQRSETSFVALPAARRFSAVSHRGLVGKLLYPLGPSIWNRDEREALFTDPEPVSWINKEKAQFFVNERFHLLSVLFTF